MAGSAILIHTVCRAWVPVGLIPARLQDALTWRCCSQRPSGLRNGPWLGLSTELWRWEGPGLPMTWLQECALMVSLVAHTLPPTLDDISSSDARKALMAGAGSEDLQTILHPKVIEWHRTCDFTYRALDQEPEPAEHDVPAPAGGAKRGRDAAC